MREFNEQWAERTGGDATVPSQGLDGLILASAAASGKVVAANADRRPSIDAQHREAFMAEGAEPEEPAIFDSAGVYFENQATEAEQGEMERYLSEPDEDAWAYEDEENEGE